MRLLSSALGPLRGVVGVIRAVPGVPLQGAAMRVGRFADRLPQRRFAREASRNGHPGA